MIADEPAGSPGPYDRALLLLRQHLARERPELAATGMALGAPCSFVERLAAHAVTGGFRLSSDLDMIEVDGVPIASLPDPAREAASKVVGYVLTRIRFPLPWRPDPPRGVSQWEALATALQDGLSLPAALTLAELEYP